MSENTNYLLLIDYNLTRYDDVKTLTSYAKKQYQLETILIRPNPNSIDRGIADQIIDLDPRAKDFLAKAENILIPFRYYIKAGLVFSDNAVYAGAKLLEMLGLEVDNPDLAHAAYSKIAYRELETAYKKLCDAQHIFVPDYCRINQAAQLVEFACQHPEGIVLKPACEGNNRGVIFLDEHADFDAAMQMVIPYLKDGLICEANISFAEEYSLDGLAHLSFITKKLSASGKYPVEYGQLISSKLSSQVTALVTRAGTIANLLVGQHAGPFHNEVKVSLQHNKVAVIEPNRRPAGMRIWSLAEKVFKTNFYYLWIDRLLNKNIPRVLPHARGQAAIRMLTVPVDGIFSLPACIDDPALIFQNSLRLFYKRMAATAERTQQNIRTLQNKLEWFDFKISKSAGDAVFSLSRDNSDFMGHICLYTEDDSIDIVRLLNEFNQCWMQTIAPYITQTLGEAI